MSRTYEMASGYVASPDGRAVDNGSTVVIRLSGDVNGTIVPATDLRRADGTAWPTEGVVTDENGKVVVQVPGAGPYPAMLWSDTGRGLWPMPPTDLSARLDQLEEVGAVLTGDQAAALAAITPVVQVADTLTGFTLNLSGLAGGTNGYTLTGLPGSYPTETSALNALLQALPNDAIIDCGGKTFAHAALTPIDNKKRLTFRNGGFMSTTLASSLQFRGCSSIKFEGFHLIAAVMPADRTTAADEHTNSMLMLDGCYDISGDVRVIGSPNAGIILWDSSLVDLDADIAETRADGLNIHSGSRFVTVRAKVRRSGDDYVAAYSYEQAKPGWRWRSSGGSGVYAPPRDYNVALDGDGGNAKRVALASNGGQGGRGAYLSGENGTISGTIAGAAQAGILIGRIVNTGSAPYSTCRTKNITVLPGTVVDGNCLMSNDYAQVSVTAGGGSGVTGPEVDTVTVSRVKIKGTTGLSAMAVIPNSDLHTAADAMANVMFTDNDTYSPGSLYGGVIATSFVYGGDNSPWFAARRNARRPNADWTGTPGWALEIGTAGAATLTTDEILTVVSGSGQFVPIASAQGVLLDKDAGKVFYATGVDGEYLMFPGGTLVTGTSGGGGGGGGGGSTTGWDVSLLADWTAPTTDTPGQNFLQNVAGGPDLICYPSANISAPAAGLFTTGRGYHIDGDTFDVALDAPVSAAPSTGAGITVVALKIKNPRVKATGSGAFAPVIDTYNVPAFTSPFGLYLEEQGGHYYWRRTGQGAATDDVWQINPAREVAPSGTSPYGGYAGEITIVFVFPEGGVGSKLFIVEGATQTVLQTFNTSGTFNYAGIGYASTHDGTKEARRWVIATGRTTDQVTELTTDMAAS